MFRWSILEEVAKSNLEGLIFTLVFSFNDDSEWDGLKKVEQLFTDKELKNAINKSIKDFKATLFIQNLEISDKDEGFEIKEINLVD